MMLRILALLFVLVTPSVAAETSPPAGDDDVQGFLESYNQDKLGPPEIVFPDYLDEDGQKALRASLVEYYRYHENGFRHRRAVFEWQLLSSKIIFAVVVLLVLIGLWFSWLQFSAGMRHPPPKKVGKTQDDQTKTADKPTTTLEASLQGIKVTSPVLGVVILALSLAFFYLYLVYVYPIEELF